MSVLMYLLRTAAPTAEAQLQQLQVLLRRGSSAEETLRAAQAWAANVSEEDDVKEAEKQEEDEPIELKLNDGGTLTFCFQRCIKETDFALVLPAELKRCVNATLW